MFSVGNVGEKKCTQEQFLVSKFKATETESSLGNCLQ